VRSSQSMARSGGAAQRLRNEESWVEIESQPSSSSLSSIGDEIVTTGLRVQQQENANRRRRRSQASNTMRSATVPQRTSTSSQEEYEESESEEADVMTSSNEHVPPVARFPPLSRNVRDVASDSDDDENATALGRVTDEPTFTPQPNAFSHPPTTPSFQRHSTGGSYFPRPSMPSSQQRQSYPNRYSDRTQHSPYNAVSPAYQADNDAALRASLTTLLSYGVAARGLPKRTQSNLTGVGPSNRTEVTGLRLVPESELNAPSPIISQPRTPSTRPRSSPSISSQDAEKGKRKATTKPATQPRAAKKKRMTAVETALISPTLLTWVFSAGVVVLVTVVGFTAGYAMGREVGRQEALNGLSDGASCGKETVRGMGEMRRFRWGGRGRGIMV